MVINPPTGFLRDQTNLIQWDFTRFVITFEPKVQITQNENLVEGIVNIYHFIVISYQTFIMPIT